MSRHTDLLEQARDHLDAAADHLDEGRHRSARRRIALARGAIERALEHDYQDPTAATGAQTSAGQEPRGFSPEAIRARDQRAAVDFAYRERMRQQGSGR